MMEKIVHRGPDSGGKYIDNGIALGFRRLSIIDLQQGDQPLFNEDKTMVLTFNGEIYNYEDLREKLTKLGHIFSTNSDSEVLLHGYEEWGKTMLTKLRGMFSFVIWNKKNAELFGARDFFGIKPFYYAFMEKSFLFGSEIKSFFPHPHFNAELNENQLENYLTFQYSPTSETFFKGVYKLPPAHYFTYKNGKINISKYYKIEFCENKKLTLDEWVEKITKTFTNSVNSHKISDVEVGSFLSSGVDSSYVAAVANVDKTFTVGFGNDEKYNEISYAKEFSKYIKKENFNKIITPQEYWESIPKIQYHMDEPLADPAAIALFFVCETASKYVKVVLSGEGADEIFGGYNIYKEPDDISVYNILPKFFRKSLSEFAKKLPDKKGVNFIKRRGKDLQERFIGNAFIFSEKERKEILKIKTKAPPFTEITKPFYDCVKDKDAVTQMQFLDLHLWLTGDILLKADKMSMANSLELRVPFLDKEVMNLARKIPTKYRVTKKYTKYAMRLSALKSCPPQTANKKKLGFPVPIRVWIKEDEYYNKIKEAFSSFTAKKFFNCEKIIQILDEHKCGKYDNSRKIWTIYIFLVWYEIYFH